MYVCVYVWWCLSIIFGYGFQHFMNTECRSIVFIIIRLHSIIQNKKKTLLNLLSSQSGIIQHDYFLRKLFIFYVTFFANNRLSLVVNQQFIKFTNISRICSTSLAHLSNKHPSFIKKFVSNNIQCSTVSMVAKMVVYHRCCVILHVCMYHLKLY